MLLDGECVSCAAYAWYNGADLLLFWSPDAGKCLSRCDEKSPVPDANNVCWSCAEIDATKPIWDGQHCVSGAAEPGVGMWDG